MLHRKHLGAEMRDERLPAYLDRDTPLAYTPCRAMVIIETSIFTRQILRRFRMKTTASSKSCWQTVREPAISSPAAVACARFVGPRKVKASGAVCG